MLESLRHYFAADLDVRPFMPPPLKRLDQSAVERAFARLFGTDDGRIVLDHLQSIAFMRCHGADATDAQIRYAEGQRALVGQIIRLITAGRSV